MSTASACLRPMMTARCFEPILAAIVGDKRIRDVRVACAASSDRLILPRSAIAPIRDIRRRGLEWPLNLLV